jgi:transposase-like protein
MQTEMTSFWDWQQHFSNEQACLQAIIKLRWPDGFRCQCCQHEKGWLLQTRHVFECAHCHHQSSITAGTLFHNTNLPLVKWLWSLYWVSSDKGSISALRLTKLIGVSWLTAQRMLRKLRTAMGDQDSLYRLRGVIELDDAFIGGKRAGKRGRGAAGKTAILVACEHNDGKPGFVAMKAVKGITQDCVRTFAEQTISPGQTLHTDAFAALKVLTEEHHHVAKVTPPELASEWLPWVHVVISNFKSYLLGTYHGISGRYVQEYLDEFCYRLNRRFWENQIPNRLLKLCVNHPPVFLQPAAC